MKRLENTLAYAWHGFRSYWMMHTMYIVVGGAFAFRAINGDNWGEIALAALCAFGLGMTWALSIWVYVDEERSWGGCEECGACGHEGCCEPEACKRLRCKYGETYESGLKQDREWMNNAHHAINLLLDQSVARLAIGDIWAGQCESLSGEKRTEDSVAFGSGSETCIVENKFLADWIRFNNEMDEERRRWDEEPPVIC